MQIVLIRFSSLGDVVLQSSLVAWLKQNFSDCKITFVTSEEFASLVQDHPFIDNVMTIKRIRGKSDICQLWKLSNRLTKDISHTIIIDLHNTLRAKLLRFFCLSTPSFVVHKRSVLRWLLVHFKWDFLKNLSSHHHRIIEDFKFIFEKEYKPQDLVEFINSKTKISQLGVTTLPQTFIDQSPIIEGQYFAISPVASFATKRWPIEYVNQLIDLVLKSERFKDFKIVIVAGISDEYCKQIRPHSRVINMQGQTSIAQSINILRFAKICVANDTGSTHLCEALAIPCLSIFGSTSESFGFKTHLNLSRSVSANVSCRPCSATGKKSCFQAKHLCMLEVTPTEIFKHFNEMWQEVVS